MSAAGAIGGSGVAQKQVYVPGAAIVALTLSVVPFAAFAQDQCVSLIQNGLYNTYRSSTGSSNISQAQAQFCSDYNSYKQTGITGNVQASYGLFSGSAGASTNQIDAVGQAMCSASLQNSSATTMISTFASVVDPSVTAAFNQCVAATNQGLIYTLTPSAIDPNTLSVSLHYQSVGNSTPQVVQSVTMNQDASVATSQSVICNGPLFTSSNITLDSNVLGMTCTRSGQAASGFSYLGQQVYAAPVRISVNTNIGNIIADMPLIPVQKPAPPPPYFTKGTIILFAGPASTIPIGWHICDGTNGTVDLRDRMPYGASTITSDTQIGTTDGSLTHVHLYDGGRTLDADIGGYQPGRAFQCCNGANLQDHSHAYPGGTTHAATNLPPATRVYFIQRIQ